jgi:hypothetical protein
MSKWSILILKRQQHYIKICTPYNLSCGKLTASVILFRFLCSRSFKTRKVIDVQIGFGNSDSVRFEMPSAVLTDGS